MTARCTCSGSAAGFLFRLQGLNAARRPFGNGRGRTLRHFHPHMHLSRVGGAPLCAAISQYIMLIRHFYVRYSQYRCLGAARLKALP